MLLIYILASLSTTGKTSVLFPIVSTSLGPDFDRLEVDQIPILKTIAKAKEIKYTNLLISRSHACPCSWNQSQKHIE